MKELLIGNAAVARGAFEAGVKVAAAYPGTPSTEITEEFSKYDNIHAEWSPNEKVAMEVAAGASLAGVRALCCMKHVGVNVAADPLFTFSYTGVNGGMVLVCADDPGMHSSQNEQDSRYYAISAHIPMLEPSDSQEAKDFTVLAYEISEKYDTPVMLRLTTRVAHSRSFVEISKPKNISVKPYSKDAAKYVMIPANARKRHIEVEKRMAKLKEDSSAFEINKAEYISKETGIICAGDVYQYVKEAAPQVSVLKLGLINPLPERLIREFAAKVENLIIAEELEPVIENQVKAMGIKCRGKELFTVQGEYSAAMIKEVLGGEINKTESISVPPRPPVMCAGCPHRGVFYVLNKLKLVVTGDIGCYSLGCAKPLNAIDSVLCMGASIGMAHGMEMADKNMSRKTVAVIGDSTFIHSGITGLINAVYNKGSLTLIILDNSTTGMTGHQDHPGTGKTIKHEDTYKLDLENLCRACGVNSVSVVDSLDIRKLENVIKTELNKNEVSVIIARKPCALLSRSKKGSLRINSKCVNCRMCITTGCPALVCGEKSVAIDASICTACGLCKEICKLGAIEGDVI
jgi:indolepyruvate ferredoxin oxidoreductase alpha subunit